MANVQVEVKFVKQGKVIDYTFSYEGTNMPTEMNNEIKKELDKIHGAGNWKRLYARSYLPR